MRHIVLIRSAYGPGWTLEANRRRLALTAGVTMRSLRAQTTRQFSLIVLLHRQDPLLAERKAIYAGAQFIYTDAIASPALVAFTGYRAAWAEAIGPRDEFVAMTRLDDDDAFAPWAMERVESEAGRARQRTILVFPLGIRVWQGGYSLVRHTTNAMHTLVTPPEDTATVYDYGHRKLRRFANVRNIDNRPAWLWSRHEDTISGWRLSSYPLTPYVRGLFPVDWSLFGEPQKQPKHSGRAAGFVFR